MSDKDDALTYDPAAAAPSLFAGSAQRARADDPPGAQPPPAATPAAAGRWLRTALRSLNIGGKPAAPADDAFAPAREPEDRSGV